MELDNKMEITTHNLTVNTVLRQFSKETAPAASDESPETMLHYKGKSVPVEQFALEYIKYDAFTPSANDDGKFKRLAAHRALAQRFAVSVCHARAFDKLFRKHYYEQLSALVRAGVERPSQLPAEPRWLARVEARLHLLPALVHAQNESLTAEAVVLSLSAQSRRRSALCAPGLFDAAARALRRDLRPRDLHRLWVIAQRVSMRYLTLSARMGDQYDIVPSQPHAHVCDTVLLNTEVDALQIVTDENDTTYMEGQALSTLWALVQRHHLEQEAPRPARELAGLWTRLHREYAAQRRSGLASVVVLQRRWYELKWRARRRLVAYWRRAQSSTALSSSTNGDLVDRPASTINKNSNAQSRPSAMHIAILRRYPHIVTSPMLSWRTLVRASQVVTQLFQPGSSDEEGVDEGGAECEDSPPVTSHKRTASPSGLVKTFTESHLKKSKLLPELSPDERGGGRRRGDVTGALGTDDNGDKLLDPGEVKTEIPDPEQTDPLGDEQPISINTGTGCLLGEVSVKIEPPECMVDRILFDEDAVEDYVPPTDGHDPDCYVEEKPDVPLLPELRIKSETEDQNEEARTINIQFEGETVDGVRETADEHTSQPEEEDLECTLGPRRSGRAKVRRMLARRTPRPPLRHVHRVLPPRTVSYHQDVDGAIDEMNNDDVPTLPQLNLLLDDISNMLLAEQVLSNGTSCCAARRHRHLAEMRARVGLAPLTSEHTHADGPCTCCCGDASEERTRQLAEAELSALREQVARMLQVTSGGGGRPEGDASAALAPDELACLGGCHDNTTPQAIYKIELKMNRNNMPSIDIKQL